MAGVIIPLFPGVYSAMGLLISDVKHDYVRSKMSPLSTTPVSGIADIFDELEAYARKELGEEEFPEERIAIERAIDMRYAGQGYEITIPCAMPLNADSLQVLRAEFDELHQKMFGHTAPDEPVEIVSYRLRGIGKVPAVKLRTFAVKGHSLEKALREHRPICFEGETLDCPVYQREFIDVGAEVSGPAIIDQLDCTTLIPPGHYARVDKFKNLILTKERG
jgi:N-methylhydantoinase A